MGEIRKFSGAPGAIRTHGLLLRREALYPAKLQVQILQCVQSDAAGYRNIQGTLLLHGDL